jgi:rhodanese-related sulfurtransferase
MNRILTVVPILGVAALAAGCSSNRHSTTRVSFAEPAYTTTESYRHVQSESDYLPSYEHSRSTYTTQSASEPGRVVTTTTVDTPQYETRTVAMSESRWMDTVSLDEFRDHVKNNSAVIVDAREPMHFSRGHIQGAINFPAGDEATHIARFRKDVEPGDLIIVYCGGPDCPAGGNVATYLRSNGYTNVRLYEPGWKELSQTDLR